MDVVCADALLRTSHGSIETHDESGAPKLYIFNTIIGPQNILSLYTTVSLHKILYAIKTFSFTSTQITTVYNTL